MMFRIGVVFAALFFPTLLFADTCKSTLNQINADITKYSTTIEQKKLPWMSLPWLKRKLGAVAHEDLDNSQYQYTWKCSEETKLIVIADKAGKLISVKSDYSTQAGAGELSACLLGDCGEAGSPTFTAPIAPVKMANNYPQAAPNGRITGAMAPGPVEALISCSDIANQINSLSQNTSPAPSQPYQFEDKNWLVSQFGNPVSQHTDKGNVSAWQCPDKVNSVLYLVSKEGIPMISSITCPTEKCSIATLVRNGKVLKGFVMQMNKADIK